MRMLNHPVELDGTNQARLKQLSERAASSNENLVQDSEFLDDVLPVRGKEFLQGNFGNPKPTTTNFEKFARPSTEDEKIMEASHVVSFSRVISDRHLEQEEEEIAEKVADQTCSAVDEITSLVSPSDHKSSDKFFATQASPEILTAELLPPGELLSPGKTSNPTEESFKQAAACPTTSPSTLSWLATQPSAEIRAAVASNHHSTQDTLRKLAGDVDATVRMAVAANKRTTDDVLKQLTHDENRLVAGEAHSVLSLREKANAQPSGPAFNKFAPPKVNPVQTKVPIIGGSLIAPNPIKPSQTAITAAFVIPPQTLSAPSLSSSLPIPPATHSPPNAPVLSDLPVIGRNTPSPTISSKMLTPRSIPKPGLASPPPSGLPVIKPTPIKHTETEPEIQPIKAAEASQDSQAFQAFQSPQSFKPDTAKASVAPDVQSTADGHNLLNNHKFKTTSNHLVASYTDLDAISIEIDNRSPGTWLSLNSEGAIKAYKKQKDTVKDVKMNLSAHNPNGPKSASPVVNITPNASPSETIAFLKIIAGRVSTPPGRLVEVSSAHQ